MPLRSRHSRALTPKVKRTRPGDSKAHLAFVRSLPCCVTGIWNVEAHHLMVAVDNAPKGMGRKHLDRWTIPVSRTTHRAVHAHGNDEEWLAEQGIDGRALAHRLWCIFSYTDDLDERNRRGLRAVERAKRVVNAGSGT